MKPSLRHVSLAAILAILSGLRPAMAAESDRAAPTGMEWWRLRSADVLVTGATRVGPSRTPQAPERSEARRAVRVVYPGLVDGR